MLFPPLSPSSPCPAFSHFLIFSAFHGNPVCSETHSFIHVLPMQKPLMRIPYTGPLPPPIIIPRNANTPTGAVHGLSNFLLARSRDNLLSAHKSATQDQTVLLTGAGVSVASGLADYRGTTGTYTLNKTYRPIYYNEFISNHEARKRYWARSFLGWTNLHRAKPNPAHWAVRDLAGLGLISSVITQSASTILLVEVPGLLPMVPRERVF